MDDLKQWLQELGSISPPSTEGMTFEEIYKVAGMGEVKLRKRLRDAVEVGLVKVGFRQKKTVIGTPRTIPVYDFKRKEKE